MISLKHLKYALAVKEFLHFKKAADACAISQSTLSTAINDLEAQLGFKVFERDNKKVLVTTLGQQMLLMADDIMMQMNDLTGLADTIKAPLSGSFSVGIIPTIAPYLLPLMLPALAEHYPRLALQVDEDQSHHLVAKVLSGQLDTAILALPYDCEGLLTFEFWEENFYLVTSIENELSQLASVKSEDIRLSNLMLLKDGHCLKDHALAVCEVNINTPFSIGGSSLNTLVELVAGGLGTTLIPEMGLQQLVNHHPRLRAIPLNEPGPHRRIAFAVRPNYPALENIERLKKLLSSQLVELIA
ncbi:hydrogen peroxide-inducible genes activator [Marinibactrum halimedae]|uniref:Transcriptional regulator n=1 Tax=Marinibactrum halimedae TaxID=1444977 RepID=A0AA37T5H8_9GAMM|nr:hydrogen peroxide-inducible genes activator [Marinibactrum halimedae]MCD9458012.1 hydrogen peroxide-inducible genes activator [Marinibactrum halimedae]GLS27638.1 transcriptional regulator [Marinibactrum halimedae]